MYLDLAGRWQQDLHGARTDPRPEEASLLQDRSYSLLQRQSTSQGNVGLVLKLLSFTLIYRAACSLLVKHSTIITSYKSLRDSKLPVTGYLRTKGQESVYETCAYIIHTILLSYMCINNYCQSFHINVCAGYMCFVKL